MATRINWTLQQFRLDELTDYYKNPRSLSEKEFKQLKTSLDKFGMIDKPIVNADSAHTIIGGHQRKHVLEATGVKEIECWIPDRELSDKEVEELNIRLNKNTGSWDFDVLANEFELDDLLDWGFERGELDLDLWADDPPEDVEPQIDKAEELRVKWGVESGQLWQLGEHRLVCGDCTDKAVVERVMGEEKVGLLTDPPYGVNVTKKSSVAPGLEFSSQDWDIESPSADTLSYFLTRCGSAIIWGGNCMPLPVSPRWLAWDKKTDGMTFSEMELAWTNIPGVPRMFRLRPQNMDGGKQHPTQKPIALILWCLEFVKEMIVIDPFLGSGTTLIACERLGRKCRAVEISPAYVAVAIQRWVDVTGGVPELMTL